MNLNPYLSFDGRCEEAFTYYAETLGGTIAGIFKYGGSPMEESVPADWKDKVMHATMTLGKGTIMGADSAPQQYQPAQGFSISLEVDKVEEAERAFSALAKEGKILLPLQQTFWAPRFGMLVDRFGIPWMVSCENEG